MPVDLLDFLEGGDNIESKVGTTEWVNAQDTAQLLAYSGSSCYYFYYDHDTLPSSSESSK
jgi:hypothetical protein